MAVRPPVTEIIQILTARNCLQQASTVNCPSFVVPFRLGTNVSHSFVERIPPIKKLAECPPRKGFVTPDQYRALMQELPSHLRGRTCIAYHIANRKGELLRLEWSDVELDGKPPLLTLWPGETKNAEGRTLPILSGEMLDTLRSLKAERDEKWPELLTFSSIRKGGRWPTT